MKQHIISLCMLIAAFGSHSVAQTGKINQDGSNISSDVDINPVFAKPATAKKVTNVNSRALYSFQKIFKDANDVNWYAVDEKEKTYVVFFNSDKNPSMASFSIISKKILETSVEFKDLMGSMLNIQSSTGFDDEEEEDFR